MLVHTDYLWFHTTQRREIVRITDEVAAIVTASRTGWSNSRRPAWTTVTIGPARTTPTPT